MGILSRLVGGSIADPIQAIGKVFDSLFTSDEEREKSKFVLEKLRMQPQLLNLEIAKTQAAHRSMFVAGARPFILWVCGLGFAYVTLISPILEQVLGYPMPEVPTAIITDTMLAVLGLGGLRSFEKYTGVSK